MLVPHEQHATRTRFMKGTLRYAHTNGHFKCFQRQGRVLSIRNRALICYIDLTMKSVLRRVFKCPRRSTASPLSACISNAILSRSTSWSLNKSPGFCSVCGKGRFEAAWGVRRGRPKGCSSRTVRCRATRRILKAVITVQYYMRMNDVYKHQ